MHPGRCRVRLKCLGSFGLRPCGHRVRSASLGSLRYALGVVGFVWDRWVHCGELCGTSESLGSFGCALVVVGFVGVAGLIRVRPEGRLVPSGSLRSLGCALWDVEVTGFIVVRPGCRRGRSESLGSFVWVLRVVGFVHCCWVY